MSFKCWKEKKSSTYKRPYYLNLESGISQWGVPVNKLLPAGWEMHLSKSQSKHFFTNSQKNISQWKMPAKEDENKDGCSICLDRFEEREIMTKLSCGHEFHTSCIENWLNDETSCPLCRQQN